MGGAKRYGADGQRRGMWEKLWVWYGRAKEVGCGRSYGCGVGESMCRRSYGSYALNEELEDRISLSFKWSLCFKLVRCDTGHK